MLRETSRYDGVDLVERSTDTNEEYLRSIMAASGTLPPTVVAAGFSKIYDRILDNQTIASLTNPSSYAQEDADQRCRQRKKALIPYGGKRLICVVVSLPGIIYTVEIDPCLRKVIHWECQVQ